MYIVWDVKDGEFTGNVEGSGRPDLGTLVIRYKGQMVHAEAVVLSYAARWGPDAADLEKWNNVMDEVMRKYGVEPTPRVGVKGAEHLLGLGGLPKADIQEIVKDADATRGGSQ